MKPTMAQPLAQDYSVVARIAADDPPGLYFLSNAFTRLPSGTFVAALPRTIRHSPKATGIKLDISDKASVGGVTVSRSTDSGETWQIVSLVPFPETVEIALFAYGNKLYMFIGPRAEGPGRLLVAVSEDEGASWSVPVEVLNGPHQWYCTHQQSMVVRSGRLYWAVSERCRKLAVVSCELEKGALDPEAWRVSDTEEMPIPPELNPGLFQGPSMRCLEGNVIQIGSRLRVMARAVIDRQGTANMAAVFDLQDEDGKLKLTFTQFYPLPGGQCKFYMVYDEPSRLYWMASNLPANSQNALRLEYDEASTGMPGNDRRFLMLWYACDALNWFPAGCIARAEKLTQSFMYPSLIIDGDHLAVLSRTCLHSGHFHDADLATFHYVRDFRSLAMNIWPVF
ncbi:sialidase family protein [Paenibacillus koleovorans]|uniref:sialidase family protein n=1 Tax=Paenibacillus koleovorans TaxID=121608 RepID=UPI000FD858A4|nr:sialidase family protein [Paenibacillus koleovorans]